MLTETDIVDPPVPDARGPSFTKEIVLRRRHGGRCTEGCGKWGALLRVMTMCQIWSESRGEQDDGQWKENGKTQISVCMVEIIYPERRPYVSVGRAYKYVRLYESRAKQGKGRRGRGVETLKQAGGPSRSCATEVRPHP